MSKHSEKDVIDLRSQVHLQAEERFIEEFGKYAGEEKAAKETAPTSDVETAGSIDTNVDKEVADTNHSQKNHEEQKGIGKPSYLWGSEVPDGKPGTTNRRPDIEALSTSAEAINLEDNQELLERSFSNFGEAKKVDQSTVRELLEAGKPGKYVTRTQTLMERVKGVTGRS